MSEIKYVNHLNETFVFGLESGVLIDEESLRDYLWAYELNYQRITNFNRVFSQQTLILKVHKSLVGVSNDLKNDVFELFEKDVLADKKGAFWIGDYYFNCFIVGAKNSNPILRDDFLQKEVTIVSDSPTWIKETRHNFYRHEHTDVSDMLMEYAAGNRQQPTGEWSETAAQDGLNWQRLVYTDEAEEVITTNPMLVENKLLDLENYILDYETIGSADVEFSCETRINEDGYFEATVVNTGEGVPLLYGIDIFKESLENIQNNIATWSTYTVAFEVKATNVDYPMRWTMGADLSRMRGTLIKDEWSTVYYTGAMLPYPGPVISFGDESIVGEVFQFRNFSVRKGSKALPAIFDPESPHTITPVYEKDKAYSVLDYGNFEDTTEIIYPTASTSYPYGYSYGYASNLENKIIMNHNFVDSNFNLTIYGPIINPTIFIENHPYTVNTEIEESERVVISTLDKTVKKIKRNGEEVNEFNKRNKTYSVFQKIKSGQNSVSHDGSFDFEIVLFEERSEPKWI